MADFADIFTGRLITEIPSALGAICSALEAVPTLVEVDLSDNAFGGRSADPMVSFLTNHRSLQTLRLSNNGLGPIGGNVVANALLASGKLYKQSGKPSRLRTVICGRNRLEKGSAEAWAAAYEMHGSLVEVRMYGNDIKHEGIPALARGLSKCPNLQHLDLQDNTLTESGSRAIAAALPAWPGLRTLNLSDCLLTPRGGITLATALGAGSNPKLQVLKLQYGEIDKHGLRLLARAIMEHLPELHSLELNGNRPGPGDRCIVDIRSALQGHGHPDALDDLDDMEEEEGDEEDIDGRAGDQDQDQDQEGEEEKAAESSQKSATVDGSVDDLIEELNKVSIVQ